MKTSTKLLLAVVPTLLIAACGGGDDSIDDRLDLADPKVRLVHAVPLAPNVSLFKNDQAQSAAVTDMPYKGASAYFDVGTSTDRWDVRTATSPALTVGTSTFDARRGTKYTLIALPNAGSVTEVALISDPYNKGITSDNARVRMFNASFNATDVDVYLTAATTDLATVSPTLPSVGYKEAVPATGADSVELEGGDYLLRITTAGTKSVIFSSPVSLGKNADWLLTSVPGSLSVNDVKVLVIKSDEGVPATELTTQ
jgi:Domain of unknown function (DUF4397)